MKAVCLLIVLNSMKLSIPSGLRLNLKNLLRNKSYFFLIKGTGKIHNSGTVICVFSLW